METINEVDKERIKNIDIPYICEVLKHNSDQIKELDFRDRKLNIRNTAKILNSLEDNTNVTFIDISANLLDDSIILPISSLIVKNTTVQRFYIEHIEFSYRFIVDIIDALKANQSIIEFRVNCGRYEREIISDLCERNLGKKVKIPIHILDEGSSSFIQKKIISWTEKISYLKFDLENLQNGRIFVSILQYYEKDLIIKERKSFTLKSTCKILQKLGIPIAVNLEKGFYDENDALGYLSLIYNYFHQDKYSYLNSKLYEKQVYVFHI